MKFASYKLRFIDRHVRAVPEQGLDGRKFVDPGIDLRGAEAADILEAAHPMLMWLAAREPGITVRSFSAAVPAQRVLVTLEPFEGHARPRVVRLEGSYAEELLEAGEPMHSKLSEACGRALLRRRERLP